jgi:hypothetical protein
MDGVFDGVEYAINIFDYFIMLYTVAWMKAQQ